MNQIPSVSKLHPRCTTEPTKSGSTVHKIVPGIKLIETILQRRNKSEILLQDTSHLMLIKVNLYLLRPVNQDIFVGRKWMITNFERKWEKMTEKVTISRHWTSQFIHFHLNNFIPIFSNNSLMILEKPELGQESDKQKNFQLETIRNKYIQ